MLDKVVQFFQWAKGVYEGSKVLQAITTIVNVATLVVGVKGFIQARNMLAKGQDILANKTSAGGKIPVIYGTRRVGAQIIYMDVNANDSRDLYVVYALAVGEVDEIIGKSIELDGNRLTDSARFRDGGYIGTDKISSGNYSLNTVSQNGTGIDVGAGQFGSSPTSKYRYVMNLHHGAATQTADPMLVASMPNWTSAHKLNGIAYIAAHYGYDKEGIWSGVPQLTVQVRGKKVYDPRLDSTAGGSGSQRFDDVSTYAYSDNPALTFLNYITNNEYGKGLTESQINMSTFSSAADVCDTKVDNPFFGGVSKSLTWSGAAGDSFITIGGTDPNNDWWQNKIGQLIDIYDNNGDGVITGKEIIDIQRDQFFDQNPLYRVYFNDTLGTNYSSQSTGSSLAKIKRFHCNGYLDTNKNVMENAKELLSNMRGIFLYIDGKYELQIEDTGTSTFTITDDHIIADAGISVDYGNKDKKANKVIVEFFNANKRYELDTATAFHDATPEYYSDDNDEILEIKAEFPYVSDPYIAYNMAKAILVRSRKQMTIQFLGTPEMYKLNVGDIVTLNYVGTFDTSQTCRVEALELQPNGLVAVSLIEYFDVYTWETPPEEPLEELANLPSAYAVKAPTNITFTDSSSSSTGRPILSWDAPTDYPDYEFRVNVVDDSGNQLMNRIVNTTFAELNFTPTGTNYVASITSLNTLGTESDPETETFSVNDEPVGLGDIRADAVTANTIDVNELSAISANLGAIDAGSIDIGSGNFTVSTAGFMTATGADISGDLSATTLDVVEANIQNLTLTLGGGILQDGDGNNLTVTNVINPNFPVDGLLHYFPLNGFSDPNDTTPSDVIDVVSNVTGVITGSNGSFSTDSPNGQSYVNGANTGITLLSDAQADTWQSTTGDYTVALWFKSTTQSGEALARIITRDASEFWSLVIDQDETGNQTIGLYTDADLLTWDGASVNEWHHIALVVNGTTSAKVYLDGILRITDTNIAYTTESRPVVLGCNTESTIFNTVHVFRGKLSDVRFYTKAITDKQVQSLYMNPAGGLPAKIEGDLFVTNSITSDKLIVNDLSSLSANLGSITAGSIDIGSGAFSVTSAGVLDATGATINGEFVAGSGSNIFTADADGIYLGNGTFANAPFKVLSSGEVQTTKTFTAGVAGTDEIAKMSGTGDYRFWSGSETPSNASFSVDKDGKAIAKNLVLKLTDGTVYFDSETGFSSSAISQISLTTGTKVSTVSSTFDADTEYEEITVTSTTSVNVDVSIDTNFGGAYGNATLNTAIDESEQKVPENFTLTIEHSSDGGSTYSTVVTDTFTRVNDRANPKTTPLSDEYKINTDTQELFISGGGGVIYLATTTTSLNLGCVDSDGRTTLSYTGLSLSGTTSGTTHRIRASVSTTDTNYDTTNNNVSSTTPRVLSVTDPSGNGFYIDNGGGSTVPPEGDITAVQITTASSSGLTGGANFTSGDASFTLALASSIDGAKTFTNNVVIQGNLDVQGTTTTIDTTNLDVKDKNITLNYGTGDTSANANGAGITIQDAVSAGNDATLTWDTSNDSFNFSHPLNVTGAIETTGNIILSSIGRRIQFTGTTGPLGLEFGDAEANPNFLIYYRTTPNTLTFENSGETAKHTFDLDGDYTAVRDVSVGRNLDVTGNISVTGTVDGRDIATDGTKLDGIEAGATTDQTQAEINALGITAIGLSGTPNITVGTINSGAIDVTGTVTADGLTVDGGVTVNLGSTNAVTLNGSYPYVDLVESDTTDKNTRLQTSSGNFLIRTRNDADTSATTRLLIDHSTGDISFYDDTGTSQALFWDASAESLGIGLTNPSEKLHIYGTGATISGKVEAGDGNQASLDLKNSEGEFRLISDGGELYVYDQTDAAERFRINTAGNATFTGTISSGAITSTGAIVSTSPNNRFDALSIGDDSDIYLYEGATNVLNIRTGASGSYKYFTFQDDGYFNTNSGGISTGGTARITSTGNLTNIGTISSGAITAESNGNDQIHLKGTDTNPTAILMDYNGTGSTDRVRIYNNAGGFQFLTENGDEKLSIAKTTGNATFAGTISSGQINATTTADATPAIIATNTGGLSSTIARFVGDSDSLEIRNEASTGDYRISNTGQENGIVLYDGTAGVQVFYNGSAVQSWNSSGGTEITGVIDATGQITTDSHVQSGDGSGGVALTINDGYGNANVTWNHLSGVPEQNGNSARIEVNTDATSSATMYFELKSGVTSGVAVQTDSIMLIDDTGLQMASGKTIRGNGELSLNASDVDFIVADGTDTIQNFIWRDHSASKLYLGTDDAVATLRSALDLNSNNITNAGTINSGAITVTSTVAGTTASTFSGNYSASGDVKLAVFERSGGAVASAIEYNDATTDMEFGTTTSHSFSLKTADTRRLTIDSSGNSTFTGTISSGSITVVPSVGYADGITINAGDVSTGSTGAKQIIMSFGGSSNIDYAHSIRTRHNSSEDTGNTVEVYLWDYGTDSSSTIGTKRALVLENSTGLDLLTGGYRVGGQTVIDASRNITAGTISSGAITATGVTVSGDNLAVFGPNTGWSKTLAIGGNANNSTANQASIGVTNGNLHIDAATSSATLLNFYDGTEGVYFGNGAGSHAARMSSAGGLNLGSNAVVSGYAISVSGTGVLSTSRNLTNIGTISSGNITATGADFSSTIEVNASGSYAIVDNGSVGWSYSPQESGVASVRYFLLFNYDNNASYPYLTNRTPSGRVSIYAGTAAGASENEKIRVNGGDGTTEIDMFGTLDMNTNNITGVGTISSGAITSTGTVTADDVNIADELLISRNSADTRKIVLYDALLGNNYRFYGFGVESSSFINNIYDSADTFYWYAGTSNTTRSLAMSLSGTGNLTVTGTISSGAINATGDITITSTYPKLSFVDTDNNPDISIIGGSGQIAFYDETNSGYVYQYISGQHNFNAKNLTNIGTISSGAITANDITKIVASPLVMGTGSSYQNYVVDGTSQAYQYLDTRDYMVSKGHHAGATYVIGAFSGSNHIVVPYVDGTDIFVDGVVSVSNASANTAYTISASELSAFSEITADKPIAVSKADPSSPVMNTNYVGRVLGLFVDRYQPIDIYVYSPFTKVTVEFYRKSSAPVDASSSSSGDFIYSTTIDAGSGFQFQEDVHSTTSSGNQYFIVKADGLICAESAPSAGDYTLLSPAGMELVGSTTYSPSSFGFTESSVTSSVTTVSNGSATYYRDNTGKNGIFAYGTADGAGGDAEFAVPIEYLSDYYIYPEGDITNFRLVSYKTNTIKVLDSSGTVLYTYDHRAATKSAPIFAQEGAETGAGTPLSSNGPFRFIGTAPFHLVCQNSADDEMVQLGAMQRELFTSKNRGFKSSFSSPAGTTSPFNATANTLTLPAAIYHQHGIVTGADLAVIDLSTGELEINSQGEINIKANSIEASKIAANTITASEIAASTITAAQIASNTITASQIAANTITASEIASNTITGTQINADLLNVQHFDNVSADIKSHLTTETFVPLSREGQAYVQRTGTYTGSNASFIPVTITQVRNNATYVAIFSGVLGDVSGGRVQYSLNNSTWVNANGNTNIAWSAGTYRGYTYVYTGQITTLSTSQSTVYWRVYFSGSYNHTQLSLNVMMDNTQ